LLDPTKMTCKNRFLGRLIGEAFIELLRLFQNFEMDLNFKFNQIFFKKLCKNERYKFKCIIDTISNLVQLDQESLLKHENQILDLLILVNNLTSTSKNVNERIRTRCDFMGLRINENLKAIRYSFFASFKF